MMALNISVIFVLCYLYFLMYLVKGNLCHTYDPSCEEEEGTNNR